MTKNIQIIANGDNDRRTGVAFIINKDLLDEKAVVEHKILIQNRASYLKIKWQKTEIELINVYYPNSTKEKKLFTKALLEVIEENKVNWKKPMLMGDFNFCEEIDDRFPRTGDNSSLIREFNKIKETLNIVDGASTCCPDEKPFTFTQRNETTGKASLSRIDRIYINTEDLDIASQWGVMSSPIGDHSIARMELRDLRAPKLGIPAWRLPNYLIDFPKYRKLVAEAIKESEKKLDEYEMKVRENPDKIQEIRKEFGNPQTIMADFKSKIKDDAQAVNNWRKDALIVKRNDLRRKIYCLQKNIKECTEESTKRAVADLFKTQDLLKKITTEIMEKKSNSTKAHYEVEGEKSTKYWFGLCKDRHESNIMYSLKDREGNVKTDTIRMIDIGSEYHADLQRKQPMTQERQEAIDKLKATVKVKLSEEHKQLFELGTTEDEVMEAIKLAPNGKAPGKDGLPYEFWKSWCKKDSKSQHGTQEGKDKKPNLLRLITTKIRDIEEHGTVDTKHSIGVMYLLYKKKEKDKIENYRPVTLLNTDYKIHTKALSIKLGKIAPEIIHKDQAGFVPGRHAYDHTRTSQLAPEYCEHMGIKGVIMALDQEKAYDKIAHDYLWQILETYEFPETFIKTVKALYSKAKTHVNINRKSLRPIKVARGVRQGDAMSCLLYNLAIEPLANLLREKVKGIKILNDPENLKCQLFADDTMVFLGENDKLKTIYDLTETFCKATTAKFNVEKTEFLPIGPEQFRQQVESTGEITTEDPDNKIENLNQIVKEGNLLRTLGCWVGNNASLKDTWEKIENKCESVIEKWSSKRPSLTGRVLISKALIISRVQYLATVNHLPKKTNDKISKMIKSFIWDGKKAHVKDAIAATQIEEGGLDMPILNARYETIQINWIKKWINPTQRHHWAFMTDSLLPISANSSESTKHMLTAFPFQKWELKGGAANAKTPTPIFIRELARTFRTYNAKIDFLKANNEVKGNIPIWYHPKVTSKNRWPKPPAICLSTNHNVKTTKDMWEYARNAQPCNMTSRCIQFANDTLSDHLPRKYRITNDTPTKDNLDLTPNTKLEQRRLIREGKPALFDPNVTETRSLENCIRIFGKEKNEPETPARRKQNTETPKEMSLVIILAETTNEGTENAEIVFSAIFHPEKLIKGTKVKIPGASQKTAELVATLMTVSEIPTDKPLQIIINSDYIHETFLTEHSLMEDIDWLGEEDAEYGKALLYRLRIRSATTMINNIDEKEYSDFIKLLGKKNETTKRLREATEDIDTNIPHQWQINGARLKVLTTKQIYKLAMRYKYIEKPNDHKTREMLNKIAMKANQIGGHKPTIKSIWKGIRKHPIEKKIGDFLWKSILDRHRCGEYFLRMKSQEWKEKAYCTCNDLTIESISHVLLSCPDNHSKAVWEEAEKVWTKSARKFKPYDKWPTPDLALILAAGAIDLRRQESAEYKNSDIAGLTNLLKILLTQTAWIIWKIRCSRRIGEKEISENTAKKMWTDAIRMKATTHIASLRWITTKIGKEKCKKDFKNTWCITEHTAKWDAKSETALITIGLNN